MMPTIIGKQDADDDADNAADDDDADDDADNDADDDADDDADKDKHHATIFSYRVFTVRTEDSINFFLPQK